MGGREGGGGEGVLREGEGEGGRVMYNYGEVQKSNCPVLPE